MFSPARAVRPLRQRGGVGARWWLALRAMSILAVVLLIAVIGVAVLAITGATDFGFVRDRIADAIRSNIGPGYTVDIRRAVIDTDPVLGLVVRVDDIIVRDATEVVVNVPETRFVVDPLSLLRFRVDIRSVEFDGPQLSFVRDASGRVMLAAAPIDPPAAAPATVDAPASEALAAPAVVAPGEVATTGVVAPPVPASPSAAAVEDIGDDDADATPSEPRAFPDLVSALQILDGGIEPPIEAAAQAGFERLSVVNGTISVWDASDRRQRRFSSTDINVGLDPASNGLNVTFASSGYSGRWTATIERTLDASSGGHIVSADFQQLTLGDVIPSLGDDKGLFVADVPLYGRASMRVNADGDVVEASANIDLGAGTLRFREEPSAKQRSVLLDEATIRLRWDIASKTIVVEPSTFFFGNTRGLVTGTIRQDGDPSAGRYTFAFESPGTVMAPPDSGAPPMVAQRISVSGVADLGAETLTFDNIIVVTTDGSLAAAGSLGFEPGKTPSVAFAASFSPMPLSTLKTIWIPFIAPNAREWAMEHLISGELKQGHYEVSVPAGVLFKKPVRLPDNAMKLDMRMENVTFSTIGALPPIQKAAGNIVLSGSTFGVDISAGEVEVPSGTVKVEAAAFAIPNVAKRPSDGIVEFQLAGPAAALGEIADAEPLRALSQRDISPADLSGDAEVSLSLRFPLKDVIEDGEVDWKAVVNTHGVASQVPVEGRKVSNADVAMTITPDEMTIYGKAKIDGVGADVSMSLPVGDGGEGTETEVRPGERQVRLVLDDEARKRLGVGLDDVLSGTVTALVTDGDDGAQHYELDLRRARVVLRGLGWSKGKGVPATLSFDLAEDKDGRSVSNLVLKGDGFGMSGSARLDSASNLISAEVDSLRLRKGDSLSLRLTRGKGGYAISARGSSFDLRGLIAQVRDNNDQAGGFPDIAVDAQIDKLIGYNQEVITGAKLTLVSVGGEMQKLSFSGAISGTPASLEYAVAPAGTSLDATAADGGRLFRFLDLYTRIAGGRIQVTGRGRGNGPMVGSMEVADFNVINEPTMEKVGIGRNAPGGRVDGFNPRNVHFDRMVAQFSKTPRAVVIEEALLRGAAIGATFSGRYDLKAATVSLAGTYLPAYAFNNLFSKIPLIGVIAGGGFREGLIGVTFKVEGPIAAPRVFFNPLSAVAPGIFRKIFEFQPNRAAIPGQ